jgi:hypothetical protein
MTHKLYIIGNGFDLHHGIPSSYHQFGKFLAANDPETFALVQRYFSDADEFWSDFESNLADFDAYSLIDEAENYLVSYAAENWSDAYNHDYQFEIDRVVKALSATMKSCFANWIGQLVIPAPTAIENKRLPIDPAATFLSFNYTATLQKLYGIDPSKVLQIHGSVADAPDHLVLGHGWNPDEQRPINFGTDPEDADIRVIQGNNLIDKYFKATFKPTKTIIQRHRPFFAGLASVDQIFVVGHSLSDVDIPYIDEIIRHIKASRVTWKISYHGDPTLTEGQITKLGIDRTLVDLVELSRF